MPNSMKQRATTEMASALPWKNSLLTKEEPESAQNPLNYFSKIIQDSDTFSILYEEILDKREKGILIKFDAQIDNQRTIRELDAFMIVQDGRGSNWICPIMPFEQHIQHALCPLDLSTSSAADAYRSMECFGSISMGLEDYISACSRGFENASRLLLGEELVKLAPNHRLLAVFYMFPSGSPK